MALRTLMGLREEDGVVGGEGAGDWWCWSDGSSCYVCGGGGGVFCCDGCGGLSFLLSWGCVVVAVVVEVAVVE